MSRKTSRAQSELMNELHSAWKRNKDRKPSATLVREERNGTPVLVHATPWRVPVAASCNLTIDNIRVIE